MSQMVVVSDYTLGAKDLIKSSQEGMRLSVNSAVSAKQDR